MINLRFIGNCYQWLKQSRKIIRVCSKMKEAADSDTMILIREIVWDFRLTRHNSRYHSTRYHSPFRLLKTQATAIKIMSKLVVKCRGTWCYRKVPLRTVERSPWIFYPTAIWWNQCLKTGRSSNLICSPQEPYQSVTSQLKCSTCHQEWVSNVSLELLDSRKHISSLTGMTLFHSCSILLIPMKTRVR